jgi:hypothetical protein
LWNVRRAEEQIDAAFQAHSDEKSELLDELYATGSSEGGAA